MRNLGEWAAQQLGVDSFGPCQWWGIPVGDQIGAVVVYSGYRRHMVEMSIVALTPRWATRGAIRDCLIYPFNELRVGRVQATVARKNRRARRFVEGIGFVYEGMARNGYHDGTDAAVYSMLRQDAERWIGRNDG